MNARTIGLVASLLAAFATAPLPMAMAEPQAVAAAVPRAEPPAGDPAARPRPGFQFLYGSGEGAALARQAYAALTAHALAAAAHRPAHGVVLAADATLAQPSWASCAGKPLAAIFDADETLIYNLGVEEQVARAPVQPFDQAQWERWERTGAGDAVAVPGALAAFAALRRAGIAIIVNTNRDAEHAAGTIATLRAAGLGDFTLGRTLFLRAVPASGKDSRRAIIAGRYCVVTMAGDQLGDFSDLFNAALPTDQRRADTLAGEIGAMWGDGWYVFPNPIYGTALRGSFDEVFPAATRWTDPGAAP